MRWVFVARTTEESYKNSSGNIVHCQEDGKNMLKKIMLSLLIGMILLQSTTLAAQTRKRKLLRGAVNTLTGWIELPKNIYDKTVEDNLATGLTAGLIGGVGMSVVRTGTGVYEVITFPVPCPENYEPILEPEFVLSETSVPADVYSTGPEGVKTFEVIKKEEK